MWPHPIGHCRGLPALSLTKLLNSQKMQVTSKHLPPSFLSPHLRKSTRFYPICFWLSNVSENSPGLSPSYSVQGPCPPFLRIDDSRSAPLGSWLEQVMETPRQNPTAPRLSCGLEDKPFVSSRQQACQSLKKFTTFKQTSTHLLTH